MKKDRKKQTEPMSQEPTIEAQETAVDAEEIARQAELEAVARRVVNAEHERWEAEKRKRKRKKRKRVLLGVGIAILLLIITALALRIFIFGSDPIVVNEETIPHLSPIDEDAAAKIDAMEGYSPDDTWVFYMYLVGSDLESGNSNHISDFVVQMISEEVHRINAEAKMSTNTRLRQLSEEIAAQGLEVPYCLFAPKTTLSDNTARAPYIQGDASYDLQEYMSVPLPKNVKFVIQTGGSTAWANPTVNPNRTQRFLLDSDGLKEVYNGPIANMGAPDTLADFLKFGAENYPADHKVVILWDHGGADSGFGVDAIYGDILSLPELREAFSAAFPLDRDNPPLELIYFACCLMSNAEVLDYFDGTAKYMVAAEEVTITAPTACSGWLEQFVEDTGINGAQLGKLMVDSYMNGVLQYAEEASFLMPTTMNLIDMRRAGDVYDIYGDFAQAALKSQLEDPDMISNIAYAAASSVFFANSLYDYYNLIDLELFMENAAEYFPEEANAVIEAVDDVMLYKRATEYLKDAGGISVYYPFHLDSTDAVIKCLDYINSVSDNDDINAMYYYKMTGCMNEAYQKHCADAGYGTADTLRYDELYRLHSAQTEIDEDGNMRLALTDVEHLLLQDAVYELIRVDDSELTYLGEDRYVNSDGKTLYSEFPVTWITISGVPFALEIINTDDQNIQYRTPVEHQFNRMDLILNYNYETETTTVLGLRNATFAAATLDRSVTPLEHGDKITPIYITSNLNGGHLSETYGKTVRYRDNSIVSDTGLKDGTYIARIKMEDMRSDYYYSHPIRLIVKNGKVSEAAPEKEYIPAKYR